MEIKQTNPRAAFTILDSDQGSVYLDVRTEEEFAAGHPAGAINVPLALPNPAGGMLLNADFLKIVECRLSRDTCILCGCQSGGRSQMAAQMLIENGFTNVANVQGGFGGARDPSGQLLVPGWIDSELPVSSEVDDDRSYDGLKRRYGL